MTDPKIRLDNMVDRIQKVLVQRVNPSLDFSQLSADTPLVGRGLGLDSVAALELITGLEDEFDLMIDDDGLSATVFETIGTLAEFLTREGATGS